MMDETKVKQMIFETMREMQSRPTQPRPASSPKMEFSKKLIMFTSMLYTAALIMAAFSWIYFGEFPQELMQYASWLYGATVVSYCGKSAYENKAKIEKRGGDEH